MPYKGVSGKSAPKQPRYGTLSGSQPEAKQARVWEEVNKRPNPNRGGRGTPLPKGKF